MKRQFKIVERFTVRTDTIDKYYNEVNAVGGKITPAEEHELAVKAAAGDEVAREKLILANLRFVISVAKAYANKDARLEDLINEGNCGLIEASHTFDPTTGFKFISYAVWYIRKEIFKYMSNKSRIIRMPLHSVRDLSRIDKAMEHIRSHEQIEPTIGMVLDELDKRGQSLTRETVLRVLNTNSAPAPLEGNPADPDEAKPITWLSSGEFNPTDLVNSRDFDKIKSVLFKKLSINEQYILTKRLGLDGKEAESFRSIGEYLGVRGQTASNHYDKIIRKLKVKAKELNYTPENHG